MDLCAGTPKNARVTAAGCEPVADSDRDGVPDNRDACPNTPNGTAVDARGCPPDSDADGVPDSIDQCAGTPAGHAVDPRGCELDADGDNVPDGADRCPDTPAGTAVDADGCTRVSDADGDGVADDKDRCPETAAGTAVGPDGCSAARAAGTSMVLEGVTFESGSARLTADSSTALDQVAASLKENAEAQVEIAGYTDNTGSAAVNRRLSLQRAEAVRAYLISKGVEGTRLTARGYGPDAPVGDNSTEQGRAANRRVELKIR
jgi:OOP family OmpA-OmpF porin